MATTERNSLLPSTESSWAPAQPGAGLPGDHSLLRDTNSTGHVTDGQELGKGALPH